jgi:hypothetical protein
VFYKNYFHAKKGFAMIADISNFAQKGKKVYPKFGEDIMICIGKVHTMGYIIMKSLIYLQWNN